LPKRKIKSGVFSCGSFVEKRVSAEEFIMENNLPVYLFHQGTNYRSYEFLGSHFGKLNGKRGVFFRVWAKNAKSVSVVGDFNNWNEWANPMVRISDEGIWETFIEGLKTYDNYKYAVTNEKTVLKSDPFAFHNQTAPETASKIYSIDGYVWHDQEYIKGREEKNLYEQPINIFEMNLGSWKKHADGNYYSYRKLATELVRYLKKMKYTHVEFMPLTEYPYDGSWGYQVSGYFAITSRFGTPRDFMYLVDKLHQAGIGVIMDWVPAHFPRDEHGLFEFDGSYAYEYADPLKRDHKDWGTRIFDFGKTEVQSFLVSSAMLMFDKYHIDGLRVDAVASMLYLDYGRREGEWRPNDEGGNICKEAVAFLQKLNTAVFERYKGVMMVAEESTAFPLVTMPVEMGGLGFNYKWNMGWMHDVLSYMQTDAMYRGSNHGKITYTLTYAFSENYILPISHDEVVHGKYSLINKMPGSYEQKFAQLRTFFGYMFAYPGKKLNFMGSEIGQFREWAYAEGIEYFLLEYEKHKKLQSYSKKLNELYKNTPALHEIEHSWEGFDWRVVDDSLNSVFAFERIAKNGQKILAVINFAGIEHLDYKIGVDKGKYKVLLNSDSRSFGGESRFKKRVYKTKRFAMHGKKHSVSLNIAPFSVYYLLKVE